MTDSELGILHYGQSSKLENNQINHRKQFRYYKMQNQRIHTNVKKFKGVIYPFDALDDQNLGIKRKGSSVLDSKKPKKARMRQPDKFQTLPPE